MATDLVKREGETALVKKENETGLINELREGITEYKNEYTGATLATFFCLMLTIGSALSAVVIGGYTSVGFGLGSAIASALCINSAIFNRKALKRARAKLALWQNARSLAESQRNLLKGDLPDDDAAELCESWNGIAEIEAQVQELAERKKKLVKKTEEDWL